MGFSTLPPKNDSFRRVKSDISPQEKRLYNAAEATAYLGMAEQTVRQWASMGKLAKVKVGVKALRFRKEDLDRIIDEGWVPARSHE